MAVKPFHETGTSVQRTGTQRIAKPAKRQCKTARSALRNGPSWLTIHTVLQAGATQTHPASSLCKQFWRCRWPSQMSRQAQTGRWTSRRFRAAARQIAFRFCRRYSGLPQEKAGSKMTTAVRKMGGEPTSGLISVNGVPPTIWAKRQ